MGEPPRYSRRLIVESHAAKAKARFDAGALRNALDLIRHRRHRELGHLGGDRGARRGRDCRPQAINLSVMHAQPLCMSLAAVGLVSTEFA